MARVLVDLPRSLESDATTREELRLKVRRMIGDTPRTKLVSNEGDATHIAHVRITDISEVDAERTAWLRLRPVGENGLGAYETFATIADGEIGESAFAALREAWGVIEGQRQLRVDTTEKVIAALTLEDVRLRDFAVIMLGERRAKEAVPALCLILKDNTHPELVLRAVGSLVAIGDPRAVDALIELSSRKDTEFVMQLVFAVGAIGGRTAEAYLVTMASGHPVEAVQHAAAQALKELREQQKAKKQP